METESRACERQLVPPSVVLNRSLGPPSSSSAVGATPPTQPFEESQKNTVVGVCLKSIFEPVQLSPPLVVLSTMPLPDESVPTTQPTAGLMKWIEFRIETMIPGGSGRNSVQVWPLSVVRNTTPYLLSIF